MNKHEIIISGVHLDLTESLKNLVNEKAEKLFNHEVRMMRLRVELEFVGNHRKLIKKAHIAKGHIEMSGSPMIVSVASNDLYKSIDLMINKLNRKIRRRSRLRKVKRHRLKELDIPAEIPKTEAA